MNYDDNLLRKVWNKAEPIPGKDAADFRRDHCGTTIQWDQYGKDSIT